MKTKITDHDTMIITCNFCNSIVITMTIPDYETDNRIYDYKSMIICGGCRMDSVGEWK